MTTLRTVVVTLLVVVLAALAYVYVGFFDVAADSPHGVVFRWLAQTTRERSIAVRAIGIKVPDLDSPTLIAAGAKEYAEMCVGCHLAPGVPDNEFRKGLAPAAPPLAGAEFARDNGEAASARRFWIIKHGIKSSAMPAWGMAHDDDVIWSIVAFLRKLPLLEPEAYVQMTADAASAHDDSKLEPDTSP
jgi:mono/diheme cytochrome c family protein